MSNVQQKALSQRVRAFTHRKRCVSLFRENFIDGKRAVCRETKLNRRELPSSTATPLVLEYY
jgi:hypothetical protein